MKKYPVDPYGIDQYLYDVNDSAWKLIDRSGRGWCFGTEPVAALKRYIVFGRATAPFLEKLLSVRPDCIARILVGGGSEQDVMTMIKKRIGFDEEVS